MAATEQARKLFRAGRIPPRVSLCAPNHHVGLPMDREKYERAGGIWQNIATCSTCGNTVHLSKFATRAEA